MANADGGLSELGLDDTLAFVRGFMLFSLLANLAEDRATSTAEPGADLAQVTASLAARGISGDAVIKTLRRGFVMPVLTAHPTEVRRKSMIDHQTRIASLLRLRDTGADTTPDDEPIDDAISRQIALLWQTRPLRRVKPGVADEIETALAWLADVFVPTLPALYARWDRAVAHASPPSSASAAGSGRPRWQSQRRRRFADDGDNARRRVGARPLSGRCPCAGRRTLDIERADTAQRGAARARGGGARHWRGTR